MIHPASLAAEDLLRDCELTFMRRGGPGGQHRNKTESAVILTHKPTGLSAEANERRSQAENRRLAVHRLRMVLACSIRTERFIEKYPSDLWLSRCKHGRIQVAVDHDDYPSLIAELLDGFVSQAMELAATAAIFQVSSSQIVRMLKQAPAAWIYFNQERSKRGLSNLH